MRRLCVSQGAARGTNAYPRRGDGVERHSTLQGHVDRLAFITGPSMWGAVVLLRGWLAWVGGGSAAPASPLRNVLAPLSTISTLPRRWRLPASRRRNVHTRGHTHTRTHAHTGVRTRTRPTTAAPTMQGARPPPPLAPRPPSARRPAPALRTPENLLRQAKRFPRLCAGGRGYSWTQYQHRLTS